MARLLGVHPIELKPGVSVEEFERFLRQEWRPADIPGVRTSIVKADRGRHAGGHAFVIECDSAVRDRYWPTPGAGGASEEWTRVANRALGSPEQRRLQEKWDALAVGPPSANYTDWVVIAE
jgi:hypothetical protein